MRPISAVLATVPLFALAACGDSGAVDDPSDPDQMAAAMEDIARPQPGEYRTTSELVEFEMPGVPEEEAQMMRSIFEMGASQPTTFCMTEEMAEAGFREFLTASQEENQECEYTAFDASGGQLSATMTCDDGQGSTGTIEFEGSISETEQDMTMTMNMANAAEGQDMRMVLRNRSERIGECSADSAAG